MRRPLPERIVQHEARLRDMKARQKARSEAERTRVAVLLGESIRTMLVSGPGETAGNPGRTLIERWLKRAAPNDRDRALIEQQLQIKIAEGKPDNGPAKDHGKDDGPHVLVHIVGPPGCEKFAIGSEVASRLDAELLAIPSAMSFKLEVYTDRDGAEKLQATDSAYKQLIDVGSAIRMARLLPPATSLVLLHSAVETSFFDETLTRELASLAADLGIGFVPVHLTCEREELVRRHISSQPTWTKDSANVDLLRRTAYRYGYPLAERSGVSLDVTRMNACEAAQQTLLHIGSLSTSSNN